MVMPTLVSIPGAKENKRFAKPLFWLTILTGLGLPSGPELSLDISFTFSSVFWMS